MFASRLSRALSAALVMLVVTAGAPAWAASAGPSPTPAEPSFVPAVSGNGRYVSFSSGHDLLHDGGGGLYRFDRQSGTTVRANVDGTGRPFSRYAPGSRLSADGDRVVFAAVEPGAPQGTDIDQIWVHEFSTGRTMLASATPAGKPTAGGIDPWSSISPDGRFVAFSAESGDLVAGDRPTQSESEVYRRDLAAGTTTRVSVGTGGLAQLTNSDASVASVSTGGRFVAFTAAAGLVPQDTDAGLDVYVRDMQTGQLELASVDSNGRLIPGSSLFGMSDDGRMVVFGAADTDRPGAAVFVRDRVAGTTRRLSVLNATGPQAGGRVTISGDGKVVALQTSTPVGADDSDGRDDVVLVDTTTAAVRPTTPDGMADPPDAQVVDPSLSFDGSVLAVDSAWHHTDSPNPGSNVDSNNSEIYTFTAPNGIWQRITPVPGTPMPGVLSPGSPGSPESPSPGLPPDGAEGRSGYWMLDLAGAVYGFGDADWYGDGGPWSVDIAPTPAGDGYWILDLDGHVSAFGAAGPLGDAMLRTGEHAMSLSPTRSGRGYWIFTDAGRVVTLGDAVSYGDMSGTSLNGPVLDSVVTPSGRGYWMVASDGGIFAFGDARFYGSMGGVPLNEPIVSMAPDPDGAGYWLVAADGGIFAFDARFYGSMGGVPLNEPVTGIVPGSAGYLMVATDGGIFAFGDVPFAGSLGDDPPPDPVVAVALEP
jgi:Tol biopolymer transport system component